MSCLARHALMALCLAALMSSALSSRAEEPIATEPERCVLYGDPTRRGVDYAAEQNLFLMANEGGIHAFDAGTGTERWHRRFHGWNAELYWGGKCILGRDEHVLFLLDKASGREVWSWTETQYGRIYGMMLSPDDSRAMVSYAQMPAQYDPNFKPEYTHVLYDFKPQRVRVFTQLKDAELAGFLADGKNIAFLRKKGPRVEPPSLLGDHGLKEYFLLDTDTGGMTAGHVIPDSDRCLWASVSPSGLLAVPKYPPEKGPTGLKVFDVRTGALVRDLGEFPDVFVSPIWTQDEKRLYYRGLGQENYCVLDAQTGALLQSISRPGHTPVSVRIGQPGKGPDMVLSQDADRNYWIWPPVADATPVKLFDGRRIAPGLRAVQMHNNGYVTAHQEIPGADVLVAHRLEDMQKVGEWRMKQTNLHEGDLFNRTFTHCINRVTNYSENGRAEKNSIDVYANGGQGPLYSCAGTPLALSPDGRFFVVQTGDKTALLLDLEQKRTVCSFNAELDYASEIQAAFSNDGRRLAVNAWPTVEVVDLADDFPRHRMHPEEGQQGFQCARGTWIRGEGQSLCFSPDGSRLLSGGYGRAWLHDAATGELLHTFVESKRFLEPYRLGQGGFLDSLAQSAKDWAGVVTDRFKGPPPPMYVAFGGMGDRVVTHVVGQIIRVWDTRSGQMISAIETGLPEKRNKLGDIHNSVVLSDNGDFAFALNRDNFAPASLWSLADGALIRRYSLPQSDSFNVALSDDGKSVYVVDKDDLYRWAGRPKDAL